MRASLLYLIPASILFASSAARAQVDEVENSAAVTDSSVRDRVPDGMFTLTDTPTAPNAGWCWYEDERALVDATDPKNPLLLIGTVSAAPKGEAEWGDIDVLWRRLGSGEQGSFELADQFERDDHDSASLYIRPDGRYLAMYSKHGTDHYTRWRISTRPHDPTEWDEEKNYNNHAGTTYNNTYHLPGDNGGKGRTYNLTRAGDRDPYVQISDDHGTTWSNAGQLLHEHWPYLRYASNGERIHFIATEDHPHEFQNGIYHGSVKDGKLYDAHGKVVDANIFDLEVVKPPALTTVFKNGTAFDGTLMYRAWTIDMATDAAGQPVAIFSARAEDKNTDHRFFYARFDGKTWNVQQLAYAGGFLYRGQWDYTGLVTIDPDNVDVVYMSSNVDPRTKIATEHYELYSGRTADRGANWNWTAITEGSSVDNLRPIVPKWNAQQTVVLWQRGSYFSYLNWDTEAVGCVFQK
ncbi:MAG: BNR-4 repeat-containing protein [Planctomycetes bacterium]|nr:BNR-4 repeat-containing protein [Planctomycetota bacterium]